MNRQFLIYYHSGNDALRRVARIHSTARLAARAEGKAVSLSDIDVLWNDEEAKKHWDGTRTIQCVSVRAGQVIERAHDPSEPAIRRLIRNL